MGIQGPLTSRTLTIRVVINYLGFHVKVFRDRDLMLETNENIVMITTDTHTVVYDDLVGIQ